MGAMPRFVNSLGNFSVNSLQLRKDLLLLGPTKETQNGVILNLHGQSSHSPIHCFQIYLQFNILSGCPQICSGMVGCHDNRWDS